MGQYDPARRRPATRKGRERGVWLYVPAEELRAARLDPDGPLYYRLHGAGKKPRQIFVRFYAEP